MDRSSMLRRSAGRSGVMAESSRVASADQYAPKPSHLGSAVAFRSKEALLKLNMPSPDAYCKADFKTVFKDGLLEVVWVKATPTKTD